MAASGLATAEEFESRFANRGGKIRLSKGLWSRYLRGEVIPQGARVRGRRSLVTRLDEEYPGSGHIFHHPIWILLDFSRSWSPKVLQAMYLHLDKSVWRLFVATRFSIAGELLPIDANFWRIPRSEEERVKRLRRLDGLDGLAACLLEVRMGYQQQSAEMFVNSLQATEAHFLKLSGTHVFSSKRMQSALLLMEGRCVSYAETMIILPNFIEGAFREYKRKIERWWKEWHARCDDHANELSVSSKNVFLRWADKVMDSDNN